MQETAVDNPYGLGALIANGDIVARSILLILLIMSLLTWFIMITKFFDQRKQRKQGIEAEREFWTSTSLTEALSKLKGTSNPFRALAETGKQAFEYHETNKTRLSGAINTSDWITESLQRTADTVSSRMQSGLPVLASVGATAPFVGLLGTVIGIYHALIAIGVAGQASIDKVAGPVGEALIMTAIGLAVAVPAVLGYNILLRRNKGVQERVSHFTHELHAYLISGAKMGLGMDKATAGPAGAGTPVKPAAAR
jgi:biopolymer transport protein ExbB